MAAPGSSGTLRLRRNVLANYVSAASIGLLTLATTPLYLRALGAEQWGLLAACMTVQGLLAMADIGMGQTMPRSIARVAGDPAALRQSWRAHVALYGAIAGLVFSVGQAAVGPLVRMWLVPAGIESAAGEIALRVLLVQFAFQFVNNAHIGYWLGTEQQVRASVWQAVFAGTRHASVLAALLAGAEGALAFLIPFAAWSAFECLANHAAVRRSLRGSEIQPLRMTDLCAVVRDASMLTLGIALGASAFQLDRWVVASALPIEGFGRYVAVAGFGLAFLQLQTPLARAFLPRLVAQREVDPTALPSVIGPLVAAIALCCVLPSAVAMAAAEPLLQVWLGDPVAAAEGILPLRLILGATMLNAAYSVVYLLILAARADRVVVAINIFVIVAMIAVIALAGRPWSATTGGAVWLAGSTAQCIGGAVWWWYTARGAPEPRRRSSENA
jgi:O-antigen/teichoic acid export membrane protein